MENNILDKIKDMLEFASKYPEIIALQNACTDVRSGKSVEVETQVIDDAFDAFEIIVKKFTSSPEEFQKLYKYLAKHKFCDFLSSQGGKITN